MRFRLRGMVARLEPKALPIVGTEGGEPARTVVGRALLEEREQGPYFSLVVTGVFYLALCWVHGHHELWRDEMHSWNVARNAGGLWDLLVGVRRYEGHPFLWYYLLFLLSRVSRSAAWLHVATIALATVSTYLWLRGAGLPRVLRVMLPFTYLFFFEYGVLSRCYAPGVFLAFLFCHLYDRASLRLPRLLGVLFLLSFTSVYGAMMAASLAVFVLGHGGARTWSLWRKTGNTRLLWQWWVPALGLIALAIILHVTTSLPPSDAFFASARGHNLGLASAIGPSRYFWAGLFPWDTPDAGNWIVSGYLGYGWSWFERILPALAAGVLLLWLAAMRGAPSVAVICLLGTVMMGLFQARQYLGFLRHWGHFFLFLVVCAWLVAKQSGRSRRLMHLLLGATMAVQILTAWRSVRTELDRPFSGALEAATYLRDHGLAGEPVLGTLDHAASGVAGYLDRRFFYPESGIEAGDERQAVVFDRHRHDSPIPMGALYLAAKLARRLGSPVLLLLTGELAGTVSPDVKIELLHVTRPSVIPAETFWIYRVRLQPP